MAAGQPIFFDRIEAFIDNIPYLPNGMITNFTMSATYNSTVNQGFSPTGLASGTTVGNKTISTINWTEYLQPLDQYINLRTLLIASPNSILTIVPVAIPTNSQAAPQFTLSGVVIRSIDITGASEGSAMTRVCTFMAVDSSNT